VKTLPVLAELDGLSVVGVLHEYLDSNKPELPLYGIYWAVRYDTVTCPVCGKEISPLREVEVTQSV
jgi:hypothetical protein